MFFHLLTSNTTVMEKKKNEHADLEKKRGIFFEIGLIISLGLVLTAFQWKTPIQKTNEFYVQNGVIYELELPDIIKKEEIKPVEPEKPKIKLFAMIEQVDNQRLIDEIPDFFGIDDDFDNPIIPFIDEIEHTGEEDIFVSVEKMPQFQGGDLNTFHRYVMHNIVYPQIAIENQVQGIVTIEFVVDKTGLVTNVAVIGRVDPVLEEEAIRAVKSSPRWTPGYQMDKAVKVKMTIPIKFQLN